MIDYQDYDWRLIDDRCPRCGYVHSIDDPNTCPDYDND